METATITDCRFQTQCAAFKDRLISAKQKGPTRLGCLQQHDTHRAGHCKIFRCMSLAKAVAKAIAEPIDATDRDDYSRQQETPQAEKAVCCAS